MRKRCTLYLECIYRCDLSCSISLRSSVLSGNAVFRRFARDGTPAVQNVVVFLSLIVLGVCLYPRIARASPGSRPSSSSSSSRSSLLLAMFFTGGGVHSGMPSWFVIGMIFTCLLIEGRLCWAPRRSGRPVSLVFRHRLFPSGIDPVLPHGNGGVRRYRTKMFIAALVIGPIIRFQSFVYESILKKQGAERAAQSGGERGEHRERGEDGFPLRTFHTIYAPDERNPGMLDISERNPAIRKTRRLPPQDPHFSEHLLSLVNDARYQPARKGQG